VNGASNFKRGINLIKEQMTSHKKEGKYFDEKDK
jgi:hypothetical protein